MIRAMIIGGLLLMAASCGEETRTTLTVEERKEVNKLYKEKLDSLNKYTIAQCEILRESKFDALVDSLKTARLKEIESIMKSKKKKR